MTTKTFMAKPNEIQQQWFLIDATNKTLGRLAAKIAHRLKGKHKPEYTPHVDVGDYIIVINAAKVKVSGDKADKKLYYHYTGYRSGMRKIPLKNMKAEDVIEHAVKGMLPKGTLGHKMLMKLKVYATDQHPHGAQNPTVLNDDNLF